MDMHQRRATDEANAGSTGGTRAEEHQQQEERYALTTSIPRKSAPSLMARV